MTEGTGKIAQELRRDKNLQTSLRWLTTKATGNAVVVGALNLLRAVGLMGRDEQFDPDSFKTKACFVGIQFAYTLVTMAPVAVRTWPGPAYRSFAATPSSVFSVHFIHQPRFPRSCSTTALLLTARFCATSLLRYADTPVARVAPTLVGAPNVAPISRAIHRCMSSFCDSPCGTEPATTFTGFARLPANPLRRSQRKAVVMEAQRPAKRRPSRTLRPVQLRR